MAAAPCAPCASAQDAPVVARVTGVVYDSIGMRPLAGAIVRLVRADDPTRGLSATSTEQGAFAYESVAAGDWLASALHPALDSLGVEPPMVRLRVVERGAVAMTLATPSPRTLVELQCGLPRDSDLGLLHGVVRSATDESLVPGAQLAADWPEWVIARKARGIRAEQRFATARASSDGRFVICGVPTGSTVRVMASSSTDSSGTVAVDIPSSGWTRHDFTIGRATYIATTIPADGADAARGDVAGDSVWVRRGQSQVTGSVRDVNGRDIAGATVRVLGSGNAARSGEGGAFTVSEAVAGTQTVEARAIGFQPVRQTVELRDGVTTPVEFRLAPQTVSLDTVRVVAGRNVDAAVLNFERRWTAGLGTFMDGNTVRNRSTVFVTDALRSINGMRVVPVGGYGQRLVARGSDGRECLVHIYIDGARMSPMQLSGAAEAFLDDFVNGSDVAALEVYVRGRIPAQYLNIDSCAVVAVWTYRRFDGVTPRAPRSAMTPR